MRGFSTAADTTSRAILAIGWALFLLGLPAAAWATSIPAQTMTFTGVPADGPDRIFVWLEDGITATGRIARHDVPDAVHLDGPGTTNFGSAIDFTTGALFEPVSVDILLSGSGYCRSGTFPEQCGGFADDPIEYVWLTGFLDDEVIGSFGLYRPADDAFETILLDSLGTVDRLRIEARTFRDLGLDGSCNVSQGCGHFSLDDLTLRAAAPAIPEPTAALVFAVGVLSVSLEARRSRLFTVTR